jgi:hypothetical protein
MSTIVTAAERAAFEDGKIAHNNRYAKGSNPHRGTAGSLCRAWNMGWTAAKKEARDGQR